MELLSGEGRNLPITKCCLHKKKERKTVLGAAGFSPKAPSRFKMRWPVHPPAPQQARSSPAGPELRQEPIPPCRPPEPMPSGATRGGLSVLGPGSGLHRSARQGWFGLRAKQRFQLLPTCSSRTFSCSQAGCTCIPLPSLYPCLPVPLPSIRSGPCVRVCWPKNTASSCILWCPLGCSHFRLLQTPML